jgi:hypothetical protein
MSSIYSKTDYQYSSNGANLAVSDSDGNVYIYHKVGEGYMKTGQFSAYINNNIAMMHQFGN